MIRYIFDKNARKIIEVNMTNSYTVSSNGDYVYIDDDGNPHTVYEEEVFTTFDKCYEHVCCFCGETIEKGTYYVKWSGIDDSFFHCCAHEDCDKLVSGNYLECDDEFSTDDIIECILDDCRDHNISYEGKSIHELVKELIKSKNGKEKN